MASLYFTQYRSRTGLATAGLHVYRSYYDRANKRVVKNHLGVVPMPGISLPPELVAQLSDEELQQVRVKMKAATLDAARRLRARAELFELAS